MTAAVGRKSKGDRHTMVTRPQRRLADAVIDQASQAGMSISDYIASVLAHAHGMPELAPQPSIPADQETLPLKTA